MPNLGLDETINAGDSGHIATHDILADKVNPLFDDWLAVGGKQGDLADRATDLDSDNIGFLWWNTDIGRLDRWNGSSWDEGIGGTVDAAFFGIHSWETSLGAYMNNGSPLLTNTASPFTQDDVGKIVIVNRIAGGATRFMSTIASVDGSGVATMADNADATVADQRMTWGFDQTTLINNAFATLAATTGTQPRVLRFGHGIFRATQIVVPTRVGWVGEGWGDPGGIADFSSTLSPTTIFKQLPGANVDHVRFGMWFALNSNSGYLLFDRIEDFMLEGPETNVVGSPYTAGGGFVFKTADGTHDLLVQDGCFMNRVQSQYHYDDGFAGPLGPVPNAWSNLRAMYNGRYGFNFAGGNPQAVHFLNFCGDGNSEGLLRVADVKFANSLIVTALKSEQGAVVANPRGTSNYQPHALILDNVIGPVDVDGICHISSLHDPPTDTGGTVFAAPGAAMKIIATADDKIPQLNWAGVGVRDHHVDNPASTETGGPGPILEDTFNGVIVPYGVAAGSYGYSRVESHPRSGGSFLSRFVFGGTGDYKGPSFPSPAVEVQGDTPVLVWHENDGAANVKTVLAALSTGEWSLRLYDDTDTIVEKIIAVAAAPGSTYNINRKVAHFNQITIPSAPLVPIQGTPVVGTAGGGRRAVMLYAAAADESAVGTMIVPTGWQTFEVRFFWTNMGAGAGSVIWLFQCEDFIDGDNLNVADGQTVSAGEAAGAQDILVETLLTGSITAVGNRQLCYRAKRVATDGGDTLGNDAGLLSIRLDRLT